MFLEWRVLEDHFYSLCNILPYDSQSTIDKLKSIPQLKEDATEQLSKLILSFTEVRKISAIIVTYLMNTLCYNGSDTDLAKLCDVMEELIDSTNTDKSIQQFKCGRFSTHP